MDGTKRQDKSECINGVVEVNNPFIEFLQIYSIYNSVKRATVASITVTAITQTLQ